MRRTTVATAATTTTTATAGDKRRGRERRNERGCTRSERAERRRSGRRRHVLAVCTPTKGEPKAKEVNVMLHSWRTQRSEFRPRDTVQSPRPTRQPQVPHSCCNKSVVCVSVSVCLCACVRVCVCVRVCACVRVSAVGMTTHVYARDFVGLAHVTHTRTQNTHTNVHRDRDFGCSHIPSFYHDWPRLAGWLNTPLRPAEVTGAFRGPDWRARQIVV